MDGGWINESAQDMEAIRYLSKTWTFYGTAAFRPQWSTRVDCPPDDVS